MTEDLFYFTADLSNLRKQLFFYSLLSQKLSPFHLKATIYGFCLVYSNWYFYYSALGPLLSQIYYLFSVHGK